jgi:hypothetical protein
MTQLMKTAFTAVAPQSVALLARSDNPFRNITCSNCRRVGHTINFCTRQGDKMAGETLDEARIAQARALCQTPNETE